MSNNNVITKSFTTGNTKMNKTYDIKLSLTVEQISQILDDRLGQKIEHGSDNIETLLNTAECIKSTALSDEFCQFFASELTPVVMELISSDSDSYDMANFQHRMLRKFAACAKSKKSA